MMDFFTILADGESGSYVKNFIADGNFKLALKLFSLIFIGFPVLFIITFIVGKYTKRRFSAQSNMVIKKAIFYIGTTIIILSILNELDFQLHALLGAAGITGIAIGFASQTSLSNIISGIFLISEQPFQVDDLIQVGDTKGIVLSIDLLSIKLRTFDNQLVRIPNELIIKEKVNNITRFPIRRLDINLGVAYKEDVKHVIRVLKDIAKNNIYCLDEPEPLILFNNFGNSSLDFLFGLWVAKGDYLKLKQSIMLEVKERFDAEDIEIPFPHMTLYTGAVTDPFPIKMIDKAESEVVDE